MNLVEFRQKYPQYNKIDDAELVDRLWRKHYAGKISRDEFAQKIG